MTDNLILAAALAYASAGWPITLCDGKRPQGIDWGHRRWTAEAIAAAFAAKPDLNVGLVLGDRSTSNGITPTNAPTMKRCLKVATCQQPAASPPREAGINCSFLMSV